MKDSFVQALPFLSGNWRSELDNINDQNSTTCSLNIEVKAGKVVQMMIGESLYVLKSDSTVDIMNINKSRKEVHTIGLWRAIDYVFCILSRTRLLELYFYSEM